MPTRGRCHNNVAIKRSNKAVHKVKRSFKQLKICFLSGAISELIIVFCEARRDAQI